MRTHYCGEVREQLADQVVTVCGWADNRRDLGGLIFVSLRDHTALLQVVIEPDNASAFDASKDIRNEFCLRITGRVRMRPESQFNERMITGKIELVADQVQVLNAAPALPFDDNAHEEIRARYRYLELRQPKMQQAIRLRHQLTQAIRNYLDSRTFVDIETPILTKATPEGARDYLVPSRVNAGKFYALPQSPQIFKQLLMMSGMDRYYQIARCFRDGVEGKLVQRLHRSVTQRWNTQRAAFSVLLRDVDASQGASTIAVLSQRFNRFSLTGWC